MYYYVYTGGGCFQAYDAVPFFPDVDLSVRVLGFWFVWLFTVPSLRARKPGEAEKVALNIAFLATPVVSFVMPFVTKVSVAKATHSSATKRNATQRMATEGSLSETA